MCSNNPVNFVDPLGLCRGYWDQRLSWWADAQLAGAYDFLKSHVKSDWGAAGAAALYAVMQYGMGIFKFPGAIGNCGYGIGNFIANPSWETAGGLAQDISVIASVLAITASAVPSLRNVTIGGRNVVQGSGPPVGTKQSPMEVKGNTPTIINNRYYSGHAIDRMQGRGIPPSVVENTIQTGQSTAGNTAGTTVHYDATNNISVVTDSTSGNVITVRYGTP